MKKFVLYTAISKDDKETGGIKRQIELVNGLLNREDIIYLFAPQNHYFNKHQNLVLHPIKKYTSRLFPNGFLNFIGNYFRLSTIAKLEYDKLIVFELTYAIQCILLGLKNIIVINRQDLFLYRELRLKSKRPLIRKLYVSFLHVIEKLILKKVDKIIVQSHFEKQLMGDRNSELPQYIFEKIKVQYNNVNPSWIANNEIENIGFETANKSSYTFHFIGNIDDSRKGLEVLLEAIVKLQADGFNMHLNIIGNGTLKEKLENKYNHLKNISFLGHLKNPLIELANSDLLIVPSLQDSFPNTIMEAFHLGIPVIGSNRGGIPEMIDSPDQLFEPNSQNIADKIRDIITKNLFEMLKKRSLERKQFFTFDWVDEIKEKIVS